MENKEKKRKNRIGYMIFSVASAIFIWAGIAYTDDQDITKTFRNADVRINGEAALKQGGLVVTGINTNGISYKLTGKRNDLISSMDGITVDVDVSEITEPGTYELEYSVKDVNPRLDIDVSFKTVTVEVGEYGKKEIPIEIRQLGSSKDKLISTETDTESVVIAGAVEEIEGVAKGVVSIDISNIEESCEYMVKYVMTDENGNMLTKNYTIESQTSEILVKNDVYNIRSLPVNVILSDALKKEYILEENETAVTPHSVTVGVENGFSYECVHVKITEADGNSVQYEFVGEEGLYIPENAKNIKIDLSLIPRDDI